MDEGRRLKPSEDRLIRDLNSATKKIDNRSSSILSVPLSLSVSLHSHSTIAATASAGPLHSRQSFKLCHLDTGLGCQSDGSSAQGSCL